MIPLVNYRETLWGGQPWQLKWSSPHLAFVILYSFFSLSQIYFHVCSLGDQSFSVTRNEIIQNFPYSTCTRSFWHTTCYYNNLSTCNQYIFHFLIKTSFLFLLFWQYASLQALPISINHKLQFPYIFKDSLERWQEFRSILVKPFQKTMAEKNGLM